MWKVVGRRTARFGAAAILAVAGVAAWIHFAPRSVPAGQPQLATLTEEMLPSFRDAFNAADGKARVLALLSPT